MNKQSEFGNLSVINIVSPDHEVNNICDEESPNSHERKTNTAAVCSATLQLHFASELAKMDF